MSILADLAAAVRNLPLEQGFGQVTAARGALIEVALILLLMSLAFNVVARYLVVGKNARSAAAH